MIASAGVISVWITYDGIPGSLRERIQRTGTMDLNTIIQSADEIWTVGSDSGDSNAFYVVSRILAAPQIEPVFVCPGIRYAHQEEISGPDGDEDEQDLTSSEPCPAYRICRGACRHVLHCGCSDYTKGFTCKIL